MAVVIHERTGLFPTGPDRAAVKFDGPPADAPGSRSCARASSLAVSSGHFRKLSYHGCPLGAPMHEPEGPYANGAGEVTL